MARSPISAETPLRLTVGQYAGALVTLLVAISGSAWAVSTFAIGGLREDVGAIRKSAEATALSVQTTDKEGILRLRDVEGKLGDQISGLPADIAGFRGDLAYNSKLVASLTGQLDEMRKDVQARQASYSDPKAVSEFVAALKEAGLDQGKIIVVPWGGAPIWPK